MNLYDICLYFYSFILEIIFYITYILLTFYFYKYIFIFISWKKFFLILIFLFYHSFGTIIFLS